VYLWYAEEFIQLKTVIKLHNIVHGNKPPMCQIYDFVVLVSLNSEKKDIGNRRFIPVYDDNIKSINLMIH